MLSYFIDLLHANKDPGQFETDYHVVLGGVDHACLGMFECVFLFICLDCCFVLIAAYDGDAFMFVLVLPNTTRLLLSDFF